VFDEWNTFKTYTTAPRAEEVTLSGMLLSLSREKLNGNYDELIGERLSLIHI